MNFISKLLVKTFESVTLDTIPLWFNRYYVMNSDKSGFYMPSKYNIISRETVYYPADLSLNPCEVRDEYVSWRYRANLAIAVVSHALTILTLMLFSPDSLFSIVVLYVALLTIFGLVVNLAEGIFTALKMAFEENGEFNLRMFIVESGLAQFSDASDYKYAISFRRVFESDYDAKRSFSNNNLVVRSRLF